MYAEATKVCCSCGIIKPASEFHVKRARRDGRQASCKSCTAAYMKKRNSTAQAKARKAELYRRMRKECPEKVLFSQCKANAKARGIDFSITLEWVESRMAAGVCELTGIPFVFAAPRHHFLPSIDRIDSDKPYTPENCRLVLWMLNAAKNVAKEDEFQQALRQVAEAVVERC